MWAPLRKAKRIDYTNHIHLTIGIDTNRDVSKLVCLLLFEDMFNYEDCPKIVYTSVLIQFIEAKGNKTYATNTTIICIKIAMITHIVGN